MIEVNRTWTRIELIHAAVDCLKSSNIIDSLRNVEWMLCELLNCSRAQLYAYPEAAVPPEIVQRTHQFVARRINHEPIQYILGFTEFYGLRINLSPAVLIPRPETEWLVEKAVNHLASIKNPSILDIGTGSGCIALAIKHVRPDADVFACDVSKDALQVARDNARALRLEIDLFHCDIQQGLPSGPTYADLDLIISNPPYIPAQERATLDKEVSEFEPEGALFVENDPLHFYKIITAVARTHLRDEGALFFETHADYASGVLHHMQESGFEHTQLIEDLAGKPRIVCGEKKPVR